MSNKKANAVKKEKKGKAPLVGPAAMSRLRRMPVEKLEKILSKMTEDDGKASVGKTASGTYAEAMMQRNPNFIDNLEKAKAEALASGNTRAVDFINRMERMNIRSKKPEENE